ncbi:Na+/H+ antiporter NhaA [Brevibacterium album]|uniref:Na+/H+ antiporter NhaA n=1 Tax=Brevibacterium album TaxID=417948 RepID=UPI000404328B|nr:Na+/H+ antiporter NhaA [Brevibacterium album]
MHSSIDRPASPFAGFLRKISAAAGNDAFGGTLLLIAAVAALVLANSPAVDWYESVRDFRLGPAALHLDLTIGTWAADGLLAIFFFVVGLELKEEFVTGRLRDPRQAAVPVAAAAGGVLAPALIFVAFNLRTGGGALQGWAIPTATDIAFAVAVLAVVAKNLPVALRIFLLTLAVVDDLIAITIIAIFYTSDLSPLWMLAAAVPFALFTLAVQRGVRAWWLLIPLGVLTWWCVHEAGIHATVAGVLLGFAVPVRPTPRARVAHGAGPGGAPHYSGLAHHFAERWGVFSTLVAVPIFAFFSAGVAVGGLSGLGEAFSDPIVLGIVCGLVLGKPIGILGTTFLLTRLPFFRLESSLKWMDMLGMSIIAGIGFTVALLVGELAYPGMEHLAGEVKIGILTGSLVSAVLGGTLLAIRSRLAGPAAAAA